MEYIRPCPFKGCTNTVVSSNGIDSHHVICCDCGAEGPSAVTSSEAIVEWNKRDGLTAGSD